VLRTLERYVLKELLRTFALALLAITFVFFLGTSFRLVKDGLTYWQILRSLPFAVPYTFPYSVPMAYLIALALTYGRLVADREVLACESCGVPPRALATPAVLVAVLLALLSLVLQSSFIPWCHQRKAAIQGAVLEEVLSLGAGEHYCRVFQQAGFDLYARTHDGANLGGVVIHEDVEDQPMTIVAERGTIARVTSEGKDAVVIDLENVTTTVFSRDPVTRAPRDPVRARLARYVHEYSFGKGFHVRTGDYSTVQLRERYAKELEGRRFAATTGLLSGSLIATDERVTAIPVEVAIRAAVASAPLVFVAIGFPLTIALRHPNRLVPLVASTAGVSLFYFAPLLLGRTIAETWGSWEFCFLGTVVGIGGALSVQLAERRLRR
jgi:lipopolysaccharide export LptBFGC system permease protein LptF